MPPVFCAVVGCGNDSRNKKISFFRIPSDKDRSGKRNPLCVERRRKWVEKLKRADLTEGILNYERVCAEHFISGKPAELYDTANPDWIPSRKMGYERQTSQDVMKSLERYKRFKSRKKLLSEPMEVVAGPSRQSSEQLQTSGVVGFSTEASSASQSHSNLGGGGDGGIDEEQLKKALKFANEKIYSLENYIQSVALTLDGFEGNDKKTLFFTGLQSFSLLNLVHNFIKPHMSEVQIVSPFQQLLITLMKLRHNYTFTDLSFRFGISRQTVSRVFFKTLNVLYYRLKWLIYWPKREELKSTMPKSFIEAFGDRVTTIIDCFEVHSEKSSNPDAASSMFSHYKHHQTVKFLIAISPQGVIIFISEAYGGKASDKHVTETSGFLDRLSPGDLVLADRGFLIKEMVGNVLAEVKTPAFLKGKSQMSPREIEESRKLSSVRVHIERVIGTLKQKFTVFHGTLSMDLISQNYSDNILVIDKMMHVCCSLYNLNSSPVPLA